MSDKKKVLMIVGEFCEGLEVYFAMQTLQMFGYYVDLACPEKNKGDALATAVHDFDGFQTYSEKRGHNIYLTLNWDSVNEKEYSGLFIPGGRGPEYVRLYERALEIVRYFANNDLPIASLCHGPQLLITAGICAGRKMTSYKAVKPDLVMAGAVFQDIPNSEAVVDGNLVTGVDWVGNGAVVRAFAELLGTKII